MYSGIDMQAHAGRLGLGFDHWPFDHKVSDADVIPWTLCLPTLVLLAQAVFLLERGKTNRQTDRRDWTPYPMSAAIQSTWVMTYIQLSHCVSWTRYWLPSVPC